MSTKNIVAQCQIVVFNWVYESNSGLFTENSSLLASTGLEALPTSQLAASTPHDISNFISEVTFSKTLGNPSGVFSIKLHNDRDWKSCIKKGSWCLIYMDNAGDLMIPEANAKRTEVLGNGHTGVPVSLQNLVQQRDKLRCIGYIDTVRAQGNTGGEKGEIDVDYVVSGRDFGVVYEETEIWHNRVKFDEMILRTAEANIKSPDSQFRTLPGLLKTLHQLVFSPGDLANSLINKEDSLTSISLQWLLPRELISALGLSLRNSNPYFGYINDLLDFKPTLATNPIQSPISAMNGGAWEILKANSMEQFHELFAELSNDGSPKLKFRPIPWRISKGIKFPQLSQYVDRFASIPEDTVELAAIDIIAFDLGEDNHARYTLFYHTIASSLIDSNGSFNLITDKSSTTGFPRVLQNSIKRHGLRVMHTQVNNNYTLGSEKAQNDLLMEFNELQLEYWANAHYFESGTIDIIGNNSIRVGKVLSTARDCLYNANKVFYIEGYTDHFSVGEKGESSWVQSITVTRGIEKSKLSEFNSRDFGQQDNSYENSGDFTGNK